MRRRPGLQSEVLVSLALVMLAATGVLAAVLGAYDEGRLRQVLGRALAREARAPGPPTASLYPGTVWWRVDPSGRAAPWGALAEPLDPDSQALAEEAARRTATMLRPGHPWDAIRFATPLPAGGVAVARLPRDVSARLRAAPPLLVAGVLLLDAAVFTAFGVYLLRRRVGLPLRRLAAAAWGVADGDLGGRVPEEGVRETAELARTFNEMSAALAARNDALEKAVADLRAANGELREAREGMDRAQRLAAVGRLAAGVAHEVGNPIGAMLAFVDLARRDASLSEAARGHLARAAEQGVRVRTILRQLLDFSRPAAGERRPVDLAEAAREARGLVLAQRRYRGVEVTVHSAPGTPEAWADPTVVGQVLLNLLLNAADAVQGRPGARVEVRVAGAPRAVRTGDDAAAVPGRCHPDAVACVVADNGPGVDPADRERIFDPFFTTKDPGEGTGLGLANAQRQVESLGGSLALEPSAAGEGARFRLVLPAAGAAGDAQAVRSAP